MTSSQTSNTLGNSAYAYTNLQQLLKEKAKSIRQERFKISTQPNISYMPLQNKRQMKTFNSMLHRVTETTKQEIRKKNANQRIYNQEKDPFETTFLIERLTPSRNKRQLERLRREICEKSKEKVNPNINSFQSMPVPIKNLKTSSQVKLYTSKDSLIKTGPISRKRIPPSSHQWKICKGSSFSNSKNSHKVITEGNEPPIKKENKRKKFRRNYENNINSRVETNDVQKFVPLGVYGEAKFESEFAEWEPAESEDRNKVFSINDSEGKQFIKTYDKIFAGENWKQTSNGRSQAYVKDNKGSVSCYGKLYTRTQEKTKIIRSQENPKAQSSVDLTKKQTNQKPRSEIKLGPSPIWQEAKGQQLGPWI